MEHRTLYCAKNNYEFGLSRIAHALDGGVGPRLCADTWLHVKRCVLGLLTAFAKQSVVLPSVAIVEVLNFLHTCESNKMIRKSLVVRESIEFLFFSIRSVHAISSQSDGR